MERDTVDGGTNQVMSETVNEAEGIGEVEGDESDLDSGDIGDSEDNEEKFSDPDHVENDATVRNKTDLTRQSSTSSTKYY